MNAYSLLILLLFPISIFAQDKKQDWIKINDETIYGFIQYDGSNFNPEVVFFKKDGQNILVEYSIEEISEFYIQPLGKKFVNKNTTDGRKLFFALQKDPNWLLLYEKDKVTEYINIGDSVAYKLNKKGVLQDEVDEKELEIFLLKYYDKDDYPFLLAKGKIKKLKKILPKTGILRKNRIGFFKAGLLSGISFGSYSDNFLRILYTKNKKIHNRFVLGGFAELPLNTSGKISLLLEAKWSYFKYSNFTDGTKEKLDFLVSYQQIEVPLILRYYIFNKDFSPYLNTGFNYYHGFDVKNKFYNSNFETPGTILISEFIPDENLTNTSDLSILLGVGARYFINYRSAIYAEMRYVRSTGINATKYEIRKREFEFLLGFSF